MKSLTLLLWLVLLLPAQWAQADKTTGDIIDLSPIEPHGRGESFAQANASSGQLTTGLYSGDIPPEEFRSILTGISNDLYLTGSISLAQLNGKKAEIEACILAHQQVMATSGPAKNVAMGLRQGKCGAAVNFATLEANIPACTTAGKVLAGSQCCGNLVAGISGSLESTTSGKKTNVACGDHAECASQICSKDEGAAAGLCAPVMTCFPVIAMGAECSPENPNCQSGICRRQEEGTGGVSCKTLSASCSAANECCSGKCTSGQCVDRFVCENCLLEGAKPTGNQQCCRGYILGLDGMCTLEMPPFILPSTTSVRRDIWRELASALFSFTAEAQTSEIPSTTRTENTSQGTWVNDEALTEKQLDYVEAEVKKVMGIKDPVKRKAALEKVYAERKQMTSANTAAIKAGQKIGKTYTQEEYIQRYNIPAITPKERSNIEMCEFDTAKDNWLDSSNLQRNADLFLRAFEVSYSGKGSQDLWHLLDAQGKPHQKNLYSRTKSVMSDIRENRFSQRDQLKYLDLLMACQCIYTFGPEKFNQAKQAFFYTQCTGRPENLICREGEMKEALKLSDSAEQPYREGQEFPNFVNMYFQKLQKMAGQGRQGVDDVANIDAGAAGINHEEVLVRWLRMRSCNQIDVFMDTEKVESEIQTIAEDLNRAKKPVARLTNYWNQRLAQMSTGGVDKAVIKVFQDDKSKDSWYRGYVHTESKVHSWTKKTMKFLLFLFLALLVVGLGFLPMIGFALAGGIAAGVLGIGILTTSLQNNPNGSYQVLEAFTKDFPSVIIEDRLVEKKSCGFLKLFYCKTFYRILHWPAFSNNPGIENSFPWKKKEERTCEQTWSTAVAYPGKQPNPCSGPFKGTMCARSFFRPTPDSAIQGQATFQPWKEIMRDRMLMDPVMPDFYEEDINLNNQWVQALNQGFQKGCQWVKTIGKAKVKAEDKSKFFPDFDRYIDAQGVFKNEFQFNQDRISKYKEAVKKYALCRNLQECGAKNYDGVSANPIGFADIFCPADPSKPCTPESIKNAELFSNYVYQLHFNWRHMSGQAGIGYPLAYLENYYLSLLHNVRLLTTLSIRRGLELDDAYNRYAQDLAIRRGHYQVKGNRYGIGVGARPTENINLTRTVFPSFRALGFPLSAEYENLPSGQGLEGKGVTGQGGATGSSLSNNFEANVLNAARRHASRVANDNKAWKNYQSQTKGNSSASRRLANTAKFFGGVNAPLASVSGMAKSGDNSSYSGIGGKLTSLSGGELGKEGEGKTEQRYGGVSAPGGSTAGSASSGSGTSSSSSELGGEGMTGADLSGYAQAGTMGGAGTDGEKDPLTDAARTTGMKEGDVMNMLDAADKNKEGGLAGSEADSLFEKVSKAYMRNLDRVLIKKRGPEKSAPKEATDPEKDEIKKIFNE